MQEQLPSEIRGEQICAVPDFVSLNPGYGIDYLWRVSK
jgi:hypothetical protein